jgi:hypothetical protein
MSNNPQTGKNQPMFDKVNYQLIAAGILLLIIGFLLMMGGASDDPNRFDYNEVYSARRITWAPILIILGLGLEVYAIMRRPKN